MIILYISNISWNWIKQRPQFIAEELAKKHTVHVCYPIPYRGAKEYNKDHMINKHNGEISKHPFRMLPNRMSSMNPLLSFLNCKLLGTTIKKYVTKYNPDVIYLTRPEQLYAIKKNYSGIVIYDCMDDYASFISNNKLKKQFYEFEYMIMKRANIVFTSSEFLQKKLRKRYSYCAEKIHLIRNAYDGNIINIKKVECKNKSTYKLAYVGTISSWFDFKIISKSLKDFAHIEYYLYGPVEPGIQIPRHPRIHYKGILPHNRIYDSICDKDCLIMTFLLNESIEAVDPVKLYEYINFDKNILCIEYPEVERFKDFVYFYNDYDSFKSQILKMMSNSTIKYSNDQRKKFLNGNTWSKRAEIIENSLEAL